MGWDYGRTLVLVVRSLDIVYCEKQTNEVMYTSRMF